ncbi:MAG: hypothetical protein DSY47_06025 [Hydrogenothermus sp.]|nr:MAG: hypothetical protein DSY47_06025 [Hydrogenothermus sp.]
MKQKLKELIVPHQVHRKLGDTLEFFEDIIILALTLVLFYVSIIAIWDIVSILIYGEAKFMDVIPKFLYLFILVELFRLMIVYLEEKRVDTSLIVKTTLIAILREIIIKAPHFKLPDFIGVSILVVVLGSLYYIPKYVLKNRKLDFRLYKPTRKRQISTIRKKKLDRKSIQGCKVQ